MGPSKKLIGLDGRRGGGAGGASVGRSIEGFRGLGSFGGSPEVSDVSGLDFDVMPLSTEEPLMPETTIL